jgi:hypothetical protein
VITRLKFNALRCLAAFCCLVLCAISARAQSERILDFHSDIRIQPDSAMQVVETIRVQSAGNQIRHGIYRDFPTRYVDGLGNRYVVGLEVLAATRDGLHEDFRVADYSNGKRIYLGRADTLVPPGPHTYTIEYSTTRQLGFFADHDELFWNVTGNGWFFPIEHASASVRLPENIPADQVRLSGYTGPQGSHERALTSSQQDDGSYTFAASRPFRAFEGLTIFVEWPKGYVTPPSSREKLRYFLQDNRDAVFALAGISAICLYYVVVWSLVGRDPAAGPIVTQYEPPAGFSPAGIRYLVQMSFDNKAFAAAVLDMAVKGFLRIEEQNGVYTLVRTAKGSTSLSPEEQAAADRLLGGRTSIVLRNENHNTISEAIAALKTWLRNAEYTTYFVTNGHYMIPAVIVSILMVLSIVASQPTMKIGVAGGMAMWLTFWSIAVIGLLSLCFRAWKSALAGGRLKSGGETTLAFIVTGIAALFLGVEVMVLIALATSVSIILVVALVASLVLHAVFHYLLKAPTRAGRGVLDKIEGFKLFLTAVDGDRLSRVSSTEKTPELFEKFLPYALALDVEQAWAEKFSGVLSSASAAGGDSAAYSPTWYSGTASYGIGAAGFVSSFSGSFSGAISSSSVAPGSSSGGGGGSGGGSGGGGGGGGGGGW